MESSGVADEKDDRMAEVLKVLEFTHQDGMAEVQVRSCRVESGFDPHGCAGVDGELNAAGELVDGNDLCCALGDEVELFVEWWEC